MSTKIRLHQALVPAPGGEKLAVRLPAADAGEANSASHDI
jgi:hypothetical protein